MTFPNLLTCSCSNPWETTCLDYPGNPQTKKSITAHVDRSSHSTREMGLKCQHLPCLSHISISPSPLCPCVGLPVTISIHLCIQSFELNFSASDVMCTAGQSHWFIHFLEKSSYIGIILLLFFLAVRTSEPNLINSQPKSLVVFHTF